MTAPSCFTKKVSIATITKKTHRYLSKGMYSMLAKLQFPLLYRLITRQYYHKEHSTQLQDYFKLFQTVNKNVFILTLSRIEVVKKLAY